MTTLPNEPSQPHEPRNPGHLRHRYIDLSHTISDGLITYPGLPVPRLGTVLSREDSRGRYADGVEFHIGSIQMCANTGTYLDTPAHRYADGHDLSGLDLSRCVDLTAVVVVPAGNSLEPSDLEALDLEAVDLEALDLAEGDLAGVAILVHTRWSEYFGTPRYFNPAHPFVSAAAAEELVRRNVSLVGIDSVNIDSIAGTDRPVHSVLLRSGIPIVEHLTNLDQVPATGARFTAVPIKIAGLGTFPVRAFATVVERPPVCEGPRAGDR